jgi:predicted ATPase/class 3 adenylate cyclase
MSGASLFSDISGFTPLTEALSEELGRRRGAEELTRHLNRVYNALVGDLHRYGGSVIAFSGDAITAWLDGDDGRRATACALAMQESMKQFAEVQTLSGKIISLAVKTAVALGPVRRFVVGDTSHVLVDVMAGKTLDRLARAEHLAGRGDVIVDGPTAESLADGLLITEWRQNEEGGEAFAAVSELTLDVPPEPWPKLEKELSSELVAQWLLPSVHNRLNKGQGEFLAELRPAVALFLRFSGIDYDEDEEAPQKLRYFIYQVEEVVGQYEGSLLQLTLGDKGSYLYAAFGAPVAHEDDVSRAASTALELQDIVDELDYLEPLQIGITRGRMRTGAYGSDTRRTYGVLGDSVNLSARLMSAAAPGEILVNEAAQAAAGNNFVWQSKPAMALKGKSVPISPWRLVERRQQSESRLQELKYSLPMVGRTGELARINAYMDKALSGQGQIVGIAAEAGMGKSRLAAEVIHLVGDKGFAGYAGECQSYGTNMVYLVWRDIWRNVFNLESGVDAKASSEYLKKELLRIDKSLGRRVPLLGTLLNIPIPDNELTASLDAKIRKASLESMLVTCIRAKAKEHPIFMVLEDCHWLDPLSSDLVDVIGRAIVDLPVFMLLVYRQLGADASRALGITKLNHFNEIPLIEFNEEEAETLIRLKLIQFFGEESAVHPELLEQVLARASGNPFYIEELLNLLRDRGIDPGDSQTLAELDLPSSLYSLILTRIDQLTERQNTTLKVASVIGRLFQAAMVWGVYPELGGSDKVKQYLDRLSILDLTPVDIPEPELLYIFKHVIIQEVAYESLLYSTRAMLHERIGGYIEEKHVDELEQFLNLLAHHYGRSENSNKKQEYVIKAGYAAQSVYDNEAAITFFQQAVPLLSSSKKLGIYEEMGKVLEILGRWDETFELYEQALDLAKRTDNAQARATFQAAQAELIRKQGKYDEAEDLLKKARSGFEALQDRGGVANTLAVAGIISAEQGDYDEAQTLWEESLALRRELGENARIASMLGNLGIVARHHKDIELARSLQEEALAIRRELADPWNIARSLINLGNVIRDQGNRMEAREKLEEALGLLREVGDKWMLGAALDNLGIVLRNLDEYNKARDRFEEALLIFRDLDDHRMMAYVLEDFANLAALENEPVRALRLAGAAAALREEINVHLSSFEAEELEESLKAARQELDEGAQEEAMRVGRLMPLDEVVNYALNSSL